jgi:hypothetical protein
MTAGRQNDHSALTDNCQALLISSPIDPEM